MVVASYLLKVRGCSTSRSKGYADMIKYWHINVDLKNPGSEECQVLVAVMQYSVEAVVGWQSPLYIKVGTWYSFRNGAKCRHTI